uniref:DUF632 domain-containing protein n=1 Tax=Leersia perrieri TaxID=77586 RepID=A0A0D9VAK2_9ORYZ
MGCTTSHDAFAAAVASRARASSSSTRRGAGDPAALCRERAALIRAAADRRYALASAHAAYFRSLAAVGDALRRFAAAALVPAPTPPPGSSPVLTLPPSPAKPPPKSSLPPSPSSSSSTVSPLSHSLSVDDVDTHRDAIHATAAAAAETSTRYHYHYMRNSPTVPTVVYENPNGEYTQGETSYGYGYGYGYAYQYGPYGEVVAEERPAARSAGPPPSPPTAEVSTWDFFDPFSSYNQFMEDYKAHDEGSSSSLHSNSPNYSELRRMEGIPELEDEAELEAAKLSTSVVDDHGGKGKRAISSNASSKGEASDGKLQRKGSSGNGGDPENGSSKGKKGDKNVESLKGSGSGDIHSGSSTGKGKKKGIAFDDNGQPIAAAVQREGGSGKSVQSTTVSSSDLSSPLHQGNRDVMEAMNEIKGQFNEAMKCGEEVSKLLEVGKVPHRNSTPRVLRYLSSRVMDPLSLTVPASSCLPKPHRKSRTLSGKASIPSNSSVAGRRNSAGNLSSTLEKLCAWEKKLYQEIKDEEKLRILYEKKYKRLKSLDERGSESSTIDATRLSVRNLQSRITINIRTANAFSSKIQNIRDEELYPQLVDLIVGLRRMWKAVLTCHEKQLSAIQNSKMHLVKAVTISQSNVAATAIVELERELAKWYRCFNKWISSQKAFVEALNGWLRKWLPEVHEENTPDGAPPFSPGKLGAPAVFVISNDWLQAIEMAPKNDVLKTIDQFSKVVHEFKKSQENEHRQKRKADHASRDYNKRREVLQRELGLSTSLDMVAVMEKTDHSHDNRVVEADKMRKKRDEEKTRHQEIVKQVHRAASATLPIGLVPVLEQIVNFSQANVQKYKTIRIRGAQVH